MAKLSGVKTIQERIEYGGKVFDASTGDAEKGDIIRMNETTFNVTEGSYYEVVRVTSAGNPIVIDDVGDDYSLAGDYFTIFKPPVQRRAVRLEVGDYAKVIANSNRHNYEIGSVVQIKQLIEYSNADDSYIAVRIDGTEGNYLWECDVVRATDEEIEQAEETAKWAKIGRKVGEYKAGDLVRVVDSLGGHSVGSIGVVESPDGTDAPLVSVNGETYYAGVELVTPVEQRFDKSA